MKFYSLQSRLPELGDYLVSSTCLKAFAFDQRFERKDAHDLVYCASSTLPRA
jgi:hypothetical protein